MSHAPHVALPKGYAFTGVVIPLLVGLGLDEFSMNPNKILNSRKIVNMLDKKECEK